MEIREYPTQDFHALNRASARDELFDLVMWALIRKTFARVELHVLPRTDDTRYPLRLRFYTADDAPPHELVISTVPEAKMPSEAKEAVRFYAHSPSQRAFTARLKEGYISSEGEQIAWAELISDEHQKRWGTQILSLWHENQWSLSLSQAPHVNRLAAPLVRTAAPAQTVLLTGDSFLTLEAEEKASAHDGHPRRFVWQIVRELAEFIVIRYETLDVPHPSGEVSATYSWRIAQETVVRLHRKHRALGPSAIDELLGFLPVADEWQRALRQIDGDTTYEEGRWVITGQVRNLDALLTALPQPIEHHATYAPSDSARAHLISCPKHRGLLTYKTDDDGGASGRLAVYQNSERFERAVARRERAIDSLWPPRGGLQ